MAKRLFKNLYVKCVCCGKTIPYREAIKTKHSRITSYICKECDTKDILVYQVNLGRKRI